MTEPAVEPTLVPESYDGCVWPMDPGCVTDSWNAHSPEVRGRALALATSTLQRLTGNRVTNCPVTVRVERHRHACFIPIHGFEPGGAFSPGIDALGEWRNGCGGPCGHDRQGLVLDAPVGRVDALVVDGQVIEPISYGLVGNRLVWEVEGTAPWLDAETVEVTYLNGYEPDALAQYAVGVLANEFAKACSSAGGKCRLPAGVTTIVRQGVTMEVASGAFPSGLTGIREVDAFITLWNPEGLSRGPKVWSPDLNRPRTVR